jgi:hypothetical protein
MRTKKKKAEPYNQTYFSTDEMRSAYEAGQEDLKQKIKERILDIGFNPSSDNPAVYTVYIKDLADFLSINLYE